MGVRSRNGKLFLDFRWNGRRVREQVGLVDTAPNRQRCEAILQKIKAEILLGEFDYLDYFPDGALRSELEGLDRSAPKTAREWLTIWHERRSPFLPNGSVAAGAEIHPTTWLHDDSVLKRRILPIIGDLPLVAVSRTKVLALRRGLREESLSAKTITNILGLLHKAFRDAEEEGIVRENPVPKLQSARRRQALRVQSLPLKPTEIADFLASIPNEVDFKDGEIATGSVLRDLYQVWFRTGWRSNEIVALRFSWLAYDREVVTLKAGRSPRRGGTEAPPKTGQRAVDCSYDPAIFEALERRRTATPQHSGNDYVFSDSAGRPFSQEWLAKRVWNPLLRQLGISHRGQYNIRDTFITLAISAGEDPGWVASVCGNSEEMIWRHYRTWMPSQRRGDGSQIAEVMADELPRLQTKPVETNRQPEASTQGIGANCPERARSGHRFGHRGGHRHRKVPAPLKKKSGGGGNRTPVRRHSTKSHYTLSSRFDLAASTPVSGILTASLEKI